MRIRTLGSLSLLLVACGGGGDDGSACVVSPAAEEADCSTTGTCPAIAVAGDAPAGTPGTFKGFADPTVASDPTVNRRVWLAYSWPHIEPGQTPTGAAVQMAAVENRLARSDDRGATFSFVQTLWPDVPLTDPEGSGEVGRLSSETASIVPMTSGGATTWYGAHLRYFLRPVTGYYPKYGTSWHVRIGAASTPAGLASAAETVLGVTGTHSAYQPNVRLDQVAGLSRPHCAMLNNPTLFAQDGTLYLIVECLAFVGQAPDYANTTTQVFATTPAGAPTSWAWRHVGKLGDAALAAELGNDTIRQPDVALTADGSLVALITPAHIDISVQTGTVGDGCVALELDSIDPPQIARDCSGAPRVRARVTGYAVGACTHDPFSATGIIATSQGLANGGNWELRRSDLHP